MLKFYPETTKVVFFDLEYYVPNQLRNRKTPHGMIFNPILKEHKVLGGVFQVYYPMLDKLNPPIEIWEWNSNNDEKEVLSKIWQFFVKEWKPLQKNKLGSLMVAGVGIAHSDMPVLLTKLIQQNIDSHEKIYDLITGCRQIDLSSATYAQFSSNHKYFSYPKSKRELYQKYLEGKKMESGKSVWDMYDDGKFDLIEQRTLEEINDTIAIYKAMFDLKTKQKNEVTWLKRNFKKLSAIENEHNLHGIK